MADVKRVISLFSEIAPENLACDWDNVGLQVGDYRQKVEKILISLDINKDVLTEAIDKNCNLILSHHPLIFNGINSIQKQTVTGGIIMEAIKNNIALYCAHTNLDASMIGLNNYLAQLLKLSNVIPLKTIKQNNYYKLVVFIPVDYFKKVRDAILDQGAGHIGNYSHSSFVVEGRGSFKPLAGSQPFVGKQGQLNQVQEMRLETIVPQSKVKEVEQVLLKTHPYEEVAYDFYPLNKKEVTAGLGIIGYLDKKTEVNIILDQLKKILPANIIKYTGSKNKSVRKIAICSGSGADFIENAATDAEMYITGDVKYHEAQLAEKLNLVLIDAGHYETEVVVKDFLTEILTKNAKKANLQIDIIKSEVNTNPWNYY